MISEAPDLAADLRALAEEYLDSPDPPWGSGPVEVELDDMEINQLRALGYAVE